MKATVASIAQRIALELDGAIAFEALILTRWAQLPIARRQEWLRGLLVRGFQRECRVLRSIQHEQANSTKAPPREAIAVEQLSTPRASPATPIPCISDNVVSFAALREVIG